MKEEDMKKKFRLQLIMDRSWAFAITKNFVKFTFSKLKLKL